MGHVLLATAYFDWLYNILGNVLAFFYALVPSYAFAIAMLTISVRMILIPLTAKQVKSQRAMQQLQPELKKLQAKYKGDRQKLNEEMMKLYKEHKANPLAGCLPLVLQMPLFIVLYRVIRSLSVVPPKHIPAGSELYHALVASHGKLESFGMNLAEKPQSVLGLMLVAAVVASGYFQQKQMTARLPKDSVNPQMQMVTKIFPVFFGMISLSVPAGVVLYFVVSNLWQIGQQAVAFRTRQAAEGADDVPQTPGKPAAGAVGPGPVSKGGSNPKGGGPTPKGGGATPKGGGSAAKTGGTAKAGGGAKTGGTSKSGPAKSQGGGGGARTPSGRVTPKGGGKPSGRVTPKGGAAGATKAPTGQKAGKAASAPTPAASNGEESLWSRLSPTHRAAAKAKRPPPAARPKGLPPTKGSSGGSSRKET
jgi:YidC/Oxa1 family membrane protein insertase